jgi:RNA polymerase sigma factor (sigma-70 family)
MGMIKAIRKYNHKISEFSTFATIVMENVILTFFRLEYNKLYSETLISNLYEYEEYSINNSGESDYYDLIADDILKETINSFDKEKRKIINVFIYENKSSCKEISLYLNKNKYYVQKIIKNFKDELKIRLNFAV